VRKPPDFTQFGEGITKILDHRLHCKSLRVAQQRIAFGLPNLAFGKASSFQIDAQMIPVDFGSKMSRTETRKFGTEQRNRANRRDCEITTMGDKKTNCSALS